MSIEEWLKNLNTAIERAVTQCFASQMAGGWNENIITRDVLHAITAEPAVTWDRLPFRSEWRVFKASGPYETANGDIALKVVLSAPDGASIVGTKFFEAKKLDVGNNRYKAFGHLQLATMQHHPGHEVLLYAIGRQGAGVQAPVIGGAKCLPTPMALMLHAKGVSALHSASSSFAYAFFQALSGRGVNWDPKQAAGFDSHYARLESRPSFIIAAHVSTPEITLELDPAYTPEGYQPLASGDRPRERNRSAQKENERSRKKDRSDDFDLGF